MKLFFPEQKAEVRWHSIFDSEQDQKCTAKDCKAKKHGKKFGISHFQLIDVQNNRTHAANCFANATVSDFFKTAQGCLIEVESLPDNFGGVKIDTKVTPEKFEYNPVTTSVVKEERTIPEPPQSIVTAKEVGVFLVDAVNFFVTELVKTIPPVSTGDVREKMIFEAAQKLASTMLIECSKRRVPLTLN